MYIVYMPIFIYIYIYNIYIYIIQGSKEKLNPQVRRPFFCIKIDVSLWRNHEFVLIMRTVKIPPGCLYMYLDTQFTQTIYENTSTITGHLRWNTYFNLLIEGQITTGMHICAVSALVPTCLPRCASTVLAQEAGCRPNKRPMVQLWPFTSYNWL